VGLLVNLINLLILQDNATRYPVLSCITLDYLPIQGSSVLCERIFPDAGLTDMKHHARLLPENFGAIQTVKGKYKKEWRRHQAQIDAKRAAEKNQWMDDSIAEVQKQKSMAETV
jgi:truncated hemoglobin YjbI